MQLGGNQMKYLLGTALAGIFFSGCMGVSGFYNLDAYNSSGELLTKNVRFTAEGSGLNTSINGMCSAFPKSTIIISNTKTGEQLAGTSPYQCR